MRNLETFHNNLYKTFIKSRHSLDFLTIVNTHRWGRDRGGGIDILILDGIAPKGRS